jgi:hypothetical protein
MSARKLTIAVAALFAVFLTAGAASASAAPNWGLKVRWAPQNIPPGGTGEFYVRPRNYGPDKATSKITIVDKLPQDLTITALPELPPGWTCSGIGGSELTCVIPPEGFPPELQELFLNLGAPPAPGNKQGENGFMGGRITVDVEAAAKASGTQMNVAEISGGGAAEAVKVENPVKFTSTPAGFGYVDGSFGAGAFDAEAPKGAPVRQAGSHPFEMRVNFDFNLKTSHDSTGEIYSAPEGLVRTVETELPRGLIGNPEATPKCSGVDFLESPPNQGLSSITHCPSDTQVGTIALELSDGALSHGFGAFTPGAFMRVPVYNLEPPKGYPADFGFLVGGVVTGQILPTLDAGNNYAIKALTPYISSFTPIRDVEFTLWGVPGDPAHDHLRGDPESGEYGAGFDAAIKPFLTMPMNCGAGSPFTQRSDSWQHPGEFTPLSSTPNVEVTGCNDPRVRFKPQVSLEPTTTAAGGPTGLAVHLEVPQREDPVTDATDLYPNGDVRAIATPPLAKAVVTMPEGMTISTSAAQGLGSCALDQIKLGTNDPATCPQSSQYGTVTLHTPILPKDAPMTGAIYIAKQNENPFHNFLSLYVVVQDPQRGLLVKIPGRVDLDPRTGQITTTFEELPQFPVSDLELRFKGGVRAALVNPTTCGTKTITAQFYSTADPSTPITKTSSYDITQNADGSACVGDLGARGFHPTMESGTVNNAGGAYSPFTVRLQRGDNDQEFSGISVTPPPGLSAKIAGLSLCSDSAIAGSEAPGRTGTEEIAHPSCPQSSEIGTVQVGTGVGQVLTYIGGKAYLAGPYKGAPLSMVVITPIVAGPYDLGVIAVRSKIDVDPVTTQLQVTSDPLPQIYQGIPVRIRDIRVNVDRPGTTFNPTNCSPLSVVGSLAGVGGDPFSTGDDVTAALSNRFQAASCASLGFKPKLDLQLFGGTKRGAHPKLRATLKARPGDANIGRAVVALPHSEFLDQGHIKTICTRVQFAANQCPAGAVYGHASATTPVLDEPLEGPVYLRSSSNKLPDLVAVLKGPASKPIEVDLDGRIDSIRGGIRTTFAVVPDVPVKTFTLNMDGGRKGLLVNSTNLCAKKYRATANFVAQSGKPEAIKPLMRNACKAKKKPGKK